MNPILHYGPTLTAGLIALFIILERIKTLFFTYKLASMEDFLTQVRQYVFKGEIPNALEYCEGFKYSPIHQVAKIPLQRASQPENMILDSTALGLQEWTHQLQKRTLYLATIANVATLLGLLGTIAGLISSFQAISSADPQQKATLLALGISQAMNATLLGLGVAIPCMIAYSFMVSRTQAIISQMETAAGHTIDILRQRFFIHDLTQEIIPNLSKKEAA